MDASKELVTASVHVCTFWCLLSDVWWTVWAGEWHFPWDPSVHQRWKWLCALASLCVEISCWVHVLLLSLHETLPLMPHLHPAYCLQLILLSLHGTLPLMHHLRKPIDIKQLKEALRPGVFELHFGQSTIWELGLFWLPISSYFAAHAGQYPTRRMSLWRKQLARMAERGWCLGCSTAIHNICVYQFSYRL